MPAAVAPRRRSRDHYESDESPDMIPSSQPDPKASKRLRLGNGGASPLSNEYPLPNDLHAWSSTLQEEILHRRGGRQSYQPGSIVRVKLANFVTYTAVEFFPGPSLNMVIGPNGTGKSTLVCAICLGLGWGPQYLGRAREVSEYVKHGCQEATIEIELAKDGTRFKENIVIRCTIKREGNKSAFSIDGKPQGKKAVMELARSLSIQIDNLCQFLPQDKVVEFAAMTPVELLRSTQRAVASQEMIDMHEQLKDLRRKQKDVQATCASDQDSLTNLEGRQRLQEADVERMREREQTVKHISHLEAARPFAAYRTARLVHKEAREKKKVAQDLLTKLQNDVEPAFRAVNAKQRYKEQIEAVERERKDGIEKAERRADAIGKRFIELQDKHNELTAEFVAEQKGVKNHRQDIARFERAIDSLKRQMEEQPSELDVQAFNERIREKRRAIQNCKDQVEELRNKQEEWTQGGRDRKLRIRQAEENLARLDSQAGKQNIKLQAQSAQSARLWGWVQEHQHNFDKPVLGPPIVECSVKNLHYVDQIEALFQKGHMLSFTVQTDDDFKKLSDAGHRLGVSESNIRTMKAGLDDFPPPVSSDSMRRLGFEHWALDLLSGPEPVMAMLCAECHIHATGIATRDTNGQQYDMLHNSPIAAWATGKSVYKISRRREYGSGASSTQVRAFKKATIWTEQPVDSMAKRELQENIAGWAEEVKGYSAEIDKAQIKIEAWRESMMQNAEEEKHLSAEKAAKQKAIIEFKALPTKLAGNEVKLAASQNALSGIRHRRKAIVDQQDEIAMQRAQIALDYADAVETLRVYHNSLHEAEITLIEAISDHEVLKERNGSVQELLQSQEGVVDALEDEAQQAREGATRLMSECRNLLTAGDPELVNFLRGLPEGQTTEALEAEIDSEKARLDLMHEGNGSVIREYEARQKKIDSLTARLQEIKLALSELDEKIKEIRDQWEPKLDSLVRKISDSFSYNMAQINCAGEVGVYKDEDFDQWAIQIRVKFRENEPLTTLDSHRQSGGERAVSTIFYLMSLQSLTRSPFRVVDEINQGMDPRNERLVHRRMVAIACGNDGMRTHHQTIFHRGYAEEVEEHETEDEVAGRGGSQYFLITPKLLHNLTYERGMRVLCIASGEYMPVDRSRVDFKGCVDIMRGLKAQGVSEDLTFLTNSLLVMYCDLFDAVWQSARPCQRVGESQDAKRLVKVGLLYQNNKKARGVNFEHA